MAQNSAAAVILAHQLGAEWADAAASAERFAGLDRRMQLLGERPVEGGTVTVYDDYGHHPTEIERTLKALRTAEDPARVICVFQPHQHSRTRFLLDQFAQSFSDADEVACVSDPMDANEVCYKCGWKHNDPGRLASTGAGIGDLMENVQMVDQCGDMVSIWDFYGEYHVLYMTAAW